MESAFFPKKKKTQIHRQTSLIQGVGAKIEQLKRVREEMFYLFGRNISVTIGPSESYDPNEQPCLPMFDLVLQEGLYEYRCTGELHQGKYVKITRIGNGIDGIVNICEVKIFTESEKHCPKSWESHFKLEKNQK